MYGTLLYSPFFKKHDLEKIVVLSYVKDFLRGLRNPLPRYLQKNLGETEQVFLVGREDSYHYLLLIATHKSDIHAYRNY